MNDNAYSNSYLSASEAGPIERSQFIRRVYGHLAAAILVFVGIEALLINSSLAVPMTKLMMSGQYSWLIVLGLFMGVSWLAQKWAQSGAGLGTQYMGLALYVVAEAVIFVPILLIATQQDPSIIAMAGMVTVGLFLGLTGVVVTTRIDFSFLRGVLMIGGFVALGIIAAGIVFGFSLGIFFSGAMVLFAGAAILYHTSNVFQHYRTDQYVAASLTLFASIALLFWYILRIFMSRR